MSIRYKGSPLIYALAFTFGAAQFLQGSEIPVWAKIVAGTFISGMTATGLLKASKHDEGKG